MERGRGEGRGRKEMVGEGKVGGTVIVSAVVHITNYYAHALSMVT